LVVVVAVVAAVVSLAAVGVAVVIDGAGFLQLFFSHTIEYAPDRSLQAVVNLQWPLFDLYVAYLHLACPAHCSMHCSMLELLVVCRIWFFLALHCFSKLKPHWSKFFSAAGAIVIAAVAVVVVVFVAMVVVVVAPLEDAAAASHFCHTTAVGFGLCLQVVVNLQVFCCPS